MFPVLIATWPGVAGWGLLYLGPDGRVGETAWMEMFATPRAAAPFGCATNLAL